MIRLDTENEELISADALKLLCRVAEACGNAEGLGENCYAHVLLCDDDTIHQINMEQRGIDRATDVLSFPTVFYPQGKTARDVPNRIKKEMDVPANACFLGDLVISVDHARAQAENYGHSENRELCYLLTHGLFHLMGYDHMCEEDKAKMRPMEEKALSAAGMSRTTDEELLQLAREAMAFSYSPYSHYRVGAALLSADGRVFQGCNVENASYGLANCAERTAIFKAISEGVKEFTAIAIAADTSAPWPCGACRQVMNEFAPDIRVLVTWGEGKTAQAPLKELLPYGFGPQSLEDIRNR